MATVSSIEARAKEEWPKASTVSVTPCGTGHVGFTGPDPTGFRLGVTEADGRIVALLSADTLESLDAKLTALLKKKGSS